MSKFPNAILSLLNFCTTQALKVHPYGLRAWTAAMMQVLTGSIAFVLPILIFRRSSQQANAVDTLVQSSPTMRGPILASSGHSHQNCGQ